MVINEVNVLDYGAKGNADDTEAIQNALNSGAGSVVIPRGNYSISSTLVIPSNVTLRGHGRLSKIVKAFHGDMVEMKDSSKLKELELDGKGDAYKGRGVIISSGTNQKILDCSIVNTAQYCIEYVGATSGAISTIDKSLLYTIDKTKVPAIKFPDKEDNGDRKVTSIDANGGLLADFSGSSTTLVTDCDTTGVVFGKSSRKVALVCNRLAGGTLGINVEVYGLNHLIVGNIVATPIVLKAGLSNSVIMANVSSGVIDESGTNTNMLDSTLSGADMKMGYGKVSPQASSLIIGAGGKSPDAVSMSFGDGSGWKLNIGTNSKGSFVPMFSFYDKGCLYFNPIPVSDARNGTLFVDKADGALKFKDAKGAVNKLY